MYGYAIEQTINKYGGLKMKYFDFKKIKEFRQSAGMTQGELANKIGVYSQQICQWESTGKDKGMNVRALEKICHALGKKSDDFFVNRKQEGERGK